MLDTIRQLLGLPTKPTGMMISYTGAADVDKLPEGYFRVFTSNGFETLGWRHGNSLNFDVHVPKPPDYDKLPCVQLNLRRYASDITRLSDGTQIQQVGDAGGNLPGESPDVIAWDDQGSGISGKEYARRADINNGLF